ncbi:MAG TPA: folate-binding protein [Dokdonella sp.]|nr:folate-binding protein [Dokdonella sp.]
MGFDMMLFSHKILMPAAVSDNRRVDLRREAEHCIVLGSPCMEPATAVPNPLDHAEIVELSGADAPAFAQSQFSSNVSALDQGNWQWSAWLDAQGRVRYLFALLHARPGQFIAWLPRGFAAGMAGELARFVFRAKVAIRVIEDLDLFEAEAEEVVVAPGKLAACGNGWAFELPGIARRVAVLAPGRADCTADPARKQRWQIADIDAGLPWIASATAGEFTPQALGLDRLGAVSLGKGCYPGQEVVARLHYRGGNKRGCFKIGIEGHEAPAPGTRIVSRQSEAPVGTVLHAAPADAHHCLALAVLPADSQPGDPLRLESMARVEVKQGMQ